MEAAISQQLVEFEKKMDKKMDERFNAVYDRFDEQDEKLNEILNVVGADLNEKSDILDNHETRITRLEKRAA